MDDFQLFHPKYRDPSTGKSGESRTLHIRFRDHHRRRQTVGAFRDVRRSESMARKLIQLVEHRIDGRSVPLELRQWVDSLDAKLRRRLIKIGLIDAVTAASEKPLHQHLDGTADEPGYRQELESRGNSTKHVDVTVSRIRTVIDGCGFADWKDMARASAPTLVQMFLADRRTKGEIGGRSFNYFVRDLKTFCRWLFESGRAPAVALAKLKNVKNAEMDTEKRRALTSDEMKVMLPIVEASPEAWQMSGPDRALLYRFAFETGLRPNQMAHLTVADFSLQGERGTVTSAAKYVKRRRQHTQMLMPGMTAILKQHFASKFPGSAAFNLPRRFRPSEMLRDDLKLARAAWLNAKGISDEERIERGKSDFLCDLNHEKEKAVFYSLRHGHGSALADAGVPQKDIAASMHHSSQRTTERYLHTSRKSLSLAIESLPDLSYPVAALKTGTDNLGSGQIEHPNPATLRKPCATPTSPMERNGVEAADMDVSEIAETAEKSGFPGYSEENAEIGLLAELADAVDSKSTARKGVSVRLR